MLAALKDAQRLSGGNWLPAATRLVVAEDYCIVQSGLPTDLLVRTHKCDILTPGFSRLVKRSSISPDSCQETALEEWLEAPASTREWAETFLRNAPSSPPFGLNGMEAYIHWVSAPTKRWVNISQVDLHSAPTILARHRAPNGLTNHYILRIREANIVGMHELERKPAETRRLQIALASIAGTPETYTVSDLSGAEVSIQYPPLPRAEQNLLYAISLTRQKADSGVWQATAPRYILTTITSTFENLGLQLRGRCA